jgi:hypothetical protein
MRRNTGCATELGNCRADGAMPTPGSVAQQRRTTNARPVINVFSERRQQPTMTMGSRQGGAAIGRSHV